MKFLLCLLCLFVANSFAADTITVTNHFPHKIKRGERSGWIIRNESARRSFKRLSGYPKGRPGYQIDHIVPLKRNGFDCHCNMQWLTIEAKRAKDRIE